MWKDNGFEWIWWCISEDLPIEWPFVSDPTHSMYDLCPLRMVWDEHPFECQLRCIVRMNGLHFGYYQKSLDLN